MSTSKHPKTEAEVLAVSLNSEWRGVEFDPGDDLRTRMGVTAASGTVRVPNVGVVQFRESSNESAVIVAVPAFKFKCSAREAKKILLALSKLIGSV